MAKSNPLRGAAGTEGIIQKIHAKRLDFARSPTWRDEAKHLIMDRRSYCELLDSVQFAHFYRDASNSKTPISFLGMVVSILPGGMSEEQEEYIEIA